MQNRTANGSIATDETDRDWGTRIHDYCRVPLYEGGL